VRRKSWQLAAVLGGLLLTHLALAGAQPLWAEYVPGPKLSIVNNSGRPASQIYLVFLARPYSETLSYNTHRIKWEDATFPIIDPADDTVTFGDYSYANYSTTLDKLSRDPVTGNHYFFLPKKENAAVPNDKAGFDSGRLWLSFQTPTYFRVYNLPPPKGVGHLTYASPTFMDPSNPNATTVFDFFEPQLSVTPGGDICTVHADTSNVESIAMPLLYQLYNGETLVGNKTKGLNRSLRELRQLFSADPVFYRLVTSVGIMAPGHGIELGKLSSTYYTNYVDYCWQHWTDNTLTFEYPSGITWTGKVVGDVLTFTGPQTVSISRPPSKDIFFCDGVFNGLNEVDKAIKNQVVSALNRTVMHLAPYPTGTETHYPWESYKPPTGYKKDGQTFMFYQQNGLTSGNYQTNVYSKILHQLSYDGTIYGFPYDDNADQSSFIDGVATEIKLTIGNSQLSTTETILSLLLLD